MGKRLRFKFTRAEVRDRKRRAFKAFPAALSRLRNGSYDIYIQTSRLLTRAQTPLTRNIKILHLEE